jgi:hypothetical protein
MATSSRKKAHTKAAAAATLSFPKKEQKKTVKIDNLKRRLERCQEKGGHFCVSYMNSRISRKNIEIVNCK